MGFLEKLLSGVLTKALGKLFDRMMDWFDKYLFRKDIVERSKKYIEETNKRVADIEELKLVADALYAKAELEKIELGDVSDETKKAIEDSREDIRRAGRELIRGKRDGSS